MLQSVTGLPVAGAVVSLLDSAGVTLAHTVSSGDGHYRLTRPASATAIRAIHIGYTPATLAIARSTSAVDLSLARLPTLLESVNVLDQPRCPAITDGPETFALWEQARAALLATVVAREADPATVRMIAYDRLLSADGGQVDRQTITDSVFVASQSVTSGRNANAYETLGYRDVDKEHDTERYYAPNADVLLDGAFARAHCMSFRDNIVDHPDQIGLAFSPIPDSGDSLVDVAGTIWIGRTSRALRSVEFHFTGIDRVRGAADTSAGGGLWYQEMANGLVMVTRWELHAPIRIRTPIRIGMTTLLAPTSKVAGIHDVGGELATARWNDGADWDAGLPQLRGRVVAAGSGAPLAGVLVGIRGTRLGGVSDSSGAFLLPPIVPGVYAIDAVDIAFADFGLSSAASVVVTVARTQPMSVALVLPSRVATIDSLCADSRRANSGVLSGTTLLVGRALLPSGAPAVDAAIRAQWIDTARSNTGIVRLHGQADSGGTFEICGVPIAVPVRLSATDDSLVSRDTSVAVHADGDIARVALRLTSVADAHLGSCRHRSLQLIDDLSATPLAGVEVIDDMTDRAIGRTSSLGQLGLATLAEGSNLLRIRRPGYEQRTLIVDIQPDDTLPITVKLHTVTQLAAVTVTATAVLSRGAIAPGFEDRAKLHFGHFLTPADMEKRWGEPMDIALGSAGVRQMTRGSSVILLGGHDVPGCPVTIYIDGILFYSAEWSGVTPPDATRMNASDYAAVEYYPDTDGAPAEFSMTGAGCGILLLWTRD